MEKYLGRRDFLRGVGVGIAIFCTGGGAKLLGRPVKVEKPNFLFIIADDCTFRDIGCYGGQAYTPNIDKLANDGMRFSHSFQAAPMCSPTRHNIYTGLYPVKSGAYPNHAYAKAGTKSIVHYLKPLGYRVGLSGKRHIATKEVFPFEYIAGNKNPDMDAVDGFVKSAKDEGKGFCLFACSNEPHTPWDKGDVSRYEPNSLKLPPYWVDTAETRNGYSKYLAEITYLDGQVGELLELLDKHGVSENTLVIFTSEQGCSLPFGKWTCYDTGLQNALVARWPGRIEAGTVSGAMIEYVDVVPTFVEAAGGEPDAVLDGASYVGVLEGKTDEHKKHVYGLMTTRGIINGSEHYGIRQVRSRRFKYIVNLTPDVKFRNVVMKEGIYESWQKKAVSDADAADKIRRYENRPGEELYDLVKDPLEWENLADDPKHAKVKKELRGKLLAWMEEQGDEGQKTEMEAFEHQARNRKKK